MKTIKTYHSVYIFLSLTLVVNCLFLFMNGYGPDLGYWFDWTKQLANQGYRNFNGNYPPVYLHWIYLVGKGLNHFNIPIENTDLLKFAWVFPIFVIHLLLVFLANRLLIKYQAESSHHLMVMLLVAINPAILINGPIWGQVDLLPSCLAMIAIYLHFSRFAFLMIPVFVLALLTKLQMICFAPVFGLLFFQKLKQHLLGVVIALVLVLLVFLPFYLVDYHKQIFKQAYMDTLGQYPVITMNAANIWIWLVGNNAPDNVQIIPNLHPVFPDTLAKAKYFGMFLFSSVCLMIFVMGVHQFYLAKKANSEHTLISYSYFYAMVCALAFFTLLPAMHERYIFPAVIAALLFSAVKGKQIGYPVLISLAATLNMLIILGINGSNIWLGLSLFITLIFLVGFIEVFSGSKLYQSLTELVVDFFSRKSVFSILFVVVISSTWLYLLDRYLVHTVVLTENQRLLNDYPVVRAHQEYGRYRLNTSVDGNPLTINGKRYAQGIGTHADSEIVFSIPKDAHTLQIGYGLDDEVGSAEVAFEIWEENKMLWRSEVIYGYEAVKTVRVPLSGKSSITLKVDSQGSNSWDHADWIEPILIF